MQDNTNDIENNEKQIITNSPPFNTNQANSTLADIIDRQQKTSIMQPTESKINPIPIVNNQLVIDQNNIQNLINNTKDLRKSINSQAVISSNQTPLSVINNNVSNQNDDIRSVTGSIVANNIQTSNMYKVEQSPTENAIGSCFNNI